MARTSKKAKTATVPVADKAETSSVPANVETTAIPEGGVEVFIALDKLKKSPRNARKTPHTEAEIEAYAASIAAKGILQNLVVEPELDAEGQHTGSYLVTIGEGRRLAQLLRAKRKEIKKTEAIRCVIDTANDPFEISLDENVTRTAMSPADQFEAFRELSVNRGWGAEENCRPLRRVGACCEAAASAWRCQPQADACLSRRQIDPRPVDGLRHH